MLLQLHGGLFNIHDLINFVTMFRPFRLICGDLIFLDCTPLCNSRRTPFHCPLLRQHFWIRVLRRGQGVTPAAVSTEQHADQDTPLRSDQNKYSVRLLGNLDHFIPRPE